MHPAPLIVGSALQQASVSSSSISQNRVPLAEGEYDLRRGYVYLPTFRGEEGLDRIALSTTIESFRLQQPSTSQLSTSGWP